MMKKSTPDAGNYSELKRLIEERLPKRLLKKTDGSISINEMHSIIHELSVRQITLEMQQEELLQSSEDLEKGLERYTELYDFAPLGHFTLAFDGTILDVNLTGTKLLGMDRALLIGCRFETFVVREDVKVFNALIEQVFNQREPGYCEVSLLNDQEPSVHRLTVHIDAVVTSDSQECWVVLSDITRQKQIEQENAALQQSMVQAQKMESIERLAGNVAHDFNNMLQVMLGKIDLLMATEELKSSTRETFSELRNAVLQSTGLTYQLLTIARKQSINPRTVDFNAAIAKMLTMLRFVIGEHITLIYTPGDNLWPVKMDVSQLEQILANLATNSKEAIQNTGTLSIETRNVTVDEAFCNVHPYTMPGGYVLLVVHDDGCGMDKETLDSLFEPFFTTKSIESSTGLGLATVYGIVRQNKGAINVFSQKGTGTTFEIYLPRSVGEESSIQSAGVNGTSGVGNETILLVEDEQSVRDVARAFLESFGYTVLVAESPAEALSLSDLHSGAIQLLITDMIMPGMSGRHLALQMAKSRPELRNLFISGYSSDSFELEKESGIYMPFLGKPFSRMELGHKVREILDGVV